MGTSAWTWHQRPEPALLNWKPRMVWDLEAAALLSVALPECCVGSHCILTAVNESHLYTICEQVQKVACKSPLGSCLHVVACVQNGNFSVFPCQTGLLRSALIPVLESLVLVDRRLWKFLVVWLYCTDRIAFALVPALGKVKVLWLGWAIQIQLHPVWWP